MPKAVIKKHVEERLRNLIRLEKREQKSTHSLSHITPVQFSKLAVLDLSGWIEITQDEIIKKILSSKNISSSEIKTFEKKYIDSNNAFSMNKFDAMLTPAVGYSSFLSFKIMLGADYDLLSSKLSSLKKIRDELAHQTRPSPSSLPSPQTVYDDYFLIIFRILKTIELYKF
ncbi:MAG: hypothetical protein AB7E85_08215 [Pseudobdellovibrionaceae bacterium]